MTKFFAFLLTPAARSVVRQRKRKQPYRIQNTGNHDVHFKFLWQNFLKEIKTKRKKKINNVKQDNYIEVLSLFLGIWNLENYLVKIWEQTDFSKWEYLHLKGRLKGHKKKKKKLGENFFFLLVFPKTRRKKRGIVLTWKRWGSRSCRRVVLFQLIFIKKMGVNEGKILTWRSVNLKKRGLKWGGWLLWLPKSFPEGVGKIFHTFGRGRFAIIGYLNKGKGERGGKKIRTGGLWSSVGSRREITLNNWRSRILDLRLIRGFSWIVALFKWEKNKNTKQCWRYSSSFQYEFIFWRVDKKKIQNIKNLFAFLKTNWS